MTYNVTQANASAQRVRERRWRQYHREARRLLRARRVPVTPEHYASTPATASRASAPSSRRGSAMSRNSYAHGDGNMSRWWRAHDDAVDNPKLWGSVRSAAPLGGSNLCCAFARRTAARCRRSVRSRFKLLRGSRRNGQAHRRRTHRTAPCRHRRERHPPWTIGTRANLRATRIRRTQQYATPRPSLPQEPFTVT